MIIEIDWLREYVDIDCSTEELSHLLSMSGLEVEAFERIELPDGRNTETMELNVTPNRGYCLSYLGVAREVAGLLNKSLNLPDTACKKGPGTPNIKDRLKVRNEEIFLCPRYAALMIENVEVGPSQDWLQNRLRAVGLRPINNIVDITNFVLMEYGQPLHAFDYERLAGHEIIIRQARDKEPFSSLTGMEMKLDSDALVIADAKKPVALAGVIGGSNSEVTEMTQTIVLESACFNPVSVRKTSKKYGLRTDSSYRFERGVDIEGVITAQGRAAHLIVEATGGKICSGRIDEYPEIKSNSVILLRKARVKRVLGLELELSALKGILDRLGFENCPNEEGFEVTVPHYRPNLSREIDLIEEIARLNGFEKVQAANPVAEINSVAITAKHRAIGKAKNTLMQAGFYEAVNYSFIEEVWAKRFQSAFALENVSTIPLKNPISQDMATMRTSLLPGLLKTALRNVNKGQQPVKIFEIGNIFYKRGNVKEERTCLAGLVLGNSEHNVWKSSGHNLDFYDLKGALDRVRSDFNSSWEYRDAAHSLLTSGRSMGCFHQKEAMGYFGELVSSITQQIDISGSVFVFEMDFDKFVDHLPQGIKFSSLPKYPETYRDLSVLVDRSVPSQKATTLVERSGGPLLSRVELYDCFESKKLKAGKKSLTFALAFQSPAKTLTDEEVNPYFEKILQVLEKELGATLRDS